MQFWQTVCLTKNRISFVHSSETIKNWKFSWKKFRKKFLGSRRMQFGQHRQGKFDKRPNCPERVTKRFLSERNESSQNVPIVTLIAVLTSLSNKSQEKQSSFSSMSENDSENFLQEKNSLQNDTMDLYNAVLKTLSENFCEKAKNFSINVRKWWINTSFKNKSFASKCSCGHVDCGFNNPAEQVRRKTA